jgi:hypothetical protein
MATNKISNPLSRFGIGLTLAILAFIGIMEVTGQGERLAGVVVPVGFFCSLFAVVFMVFQYRTGSISLVTKSGSTFSYTRKDDPVWFFLITGFFFLIAVFLTIALGSDLIFGCEGSLINSCPVDIYQPMT